MLRIHFFSLISSFYYNTDDELKYIYIHGFYLIRPNNENDLPSAYDDD